MEKVGVTLFLAEFGGSIIIGLRRHVRRQNCKSVRSLAVEKRQ
jgi:hypothetical protein